MTEVVDETSAPVLARRDGAVAWLTLNEPAAMNAISPPMLEALDRFLLEFEADPEVRCLVIEGAGRGFCSGAKLVGSEVGTEELLRGFGETLASIEASPLPVIAAVHGFALAGGLELALAADVVIASREAKLGDAHARVGFIPGGGSTARLPRAVGLLVAKRLILTGEPVSAEEAQRVGLVSVLADDDEALADVAAQEARLLAARSPLALARSKRLLNQALDLPVAEALAAEREMATTHSSSHDAAEGVAAFEEKRDPRFLGN